MNQKQRIIDRLYDVYSRSDRLEPIGDLLRSLPEDSIDDTIKSIADVAVGELLGAEEVREFNLIQKSSALHPYTCPARGTHGHSLDGELVVTAYGLACTECNYTQDLTRQEARSRIRAAKQAEAALSKFLKRPEGQQ